MPSLAARLAPRVCLRPCADSSLAPRCANSRFTAVTTALDRHLSHFIPLRQSVVVAPLVFRMQTGFPCSAALSLLPNKIWFSKNFSLEVCKLCYDDATSTIRMLDPPKERILELCLTQILPGEYAIARR